MMILFVQVGAEKVDAKAESQWVNWWDDLYNSTAGKVNNNSSNGCKRSSSTSSTSSTSDSDSSSDSSNDSDSDASTTTFKVGPIERISSSEFKSRCSANPKDESDHKKDRSSRGKSKLSNEEMWKADKQKGKLKRIKVTICYELFLFISISPALHLHFSWQS